ncbi:MAG: flagellar biosynthesis anti-sigma factor FlgM [Thermodesulfobacteriota bacterium]
MKIEGRKPPENQEVQLRPQKLGKQNPGTSGEVSSTAKQSDQVNLSGKAKELNELKQVINQLPEVRTDKVEALKKAIEEGRYEIDAFKVAGKILEEL